MDIGKDFRDPELYISHETTVDYQGDDAYDIKQSNAASFLKMEKDSLNVQADEATLFGGINSKPLGKRWDTKKKRFVNRANDVDGSSGKMKLILSESGQRIPAEMQGGRYERWKSQNRGVDFSSGTVRGPMFKHNKIHKPKQPDKYRDDYEEQKKRMEHWKANKQGGSIGLLNAEQIRTNRGKEAKVRKYAAMDRAKANEKKGRRPMTK